MSAIKHLFLNPSVSIHAGDRSWQRNVDWETAKHVGMNGTTIPSTDHRNALVTEGRDPKNVDHVIKIITDNPATKILTVIRDTSRPQKDVVIAGQKSASKRHEETVAKPARTRKNQKEQKMKKWKRNPPKGKS